MPYFPQDYHKPEECSVCLISFDDDVRPRSLPCGHTFCSQCVNKAIKNGQLACPICRTQHSASAASRFPINYGMEAFVRKLKHDQLMAMGSQTGVARKKLRSVVKEQKSSISSVIIECEEVLSQLGEYRGQLNDWKTRHLQLQERLVEQNKAVMKLLEQEDDCVVTMTSRGEEEKTRLQAMLVNLDTVNAIDNADTIIDAAEKCNVEVQHWSQKCQALFPDVNTVHTSVKVCTEGHIVLTQLSIVLSVYKHLMQRTTKIKLHIIIREQFAPTSEIFSYNEIYFHLGVSVHCGEYSVFSTFSINVCVRNDRCRRPSGSPWIL